MLVISPILTLVTLVTVPLMFWSARGIVRKSRQYFKAQQASLGSINGYIEEMISGQKVVKVFGHEQKAISDFEELNQDLKGKSLKAQFYSGLMMPVMQNLSTLNYVLITIVGALLAIFRGFDVGGLAAFCNIPDSSDVLSTSWRVFIIASRQLWLELNEYSR